MQWQTATMGKAEVVVPGGAIIHVIEEPPDDLSAMLVIRAEVVAGVSCVIILTSRPWQDGWHLSNVVERFAKSCDPETVTVEPVDLPGATVARRLDGTVRVEEDAEDAEVEAMTIVLVRTPAEKLVTLTLRMNLEDRRAAHVAVEHVIDSFRLDTSLKN